MYLFEPWKELVEVRCVCPGVELITASEMGIEGSGSGLLLELCRAAGASCYLSGPSGRNYLDEELFHRHSIAVRYHDFPHPTYPQRFAPFVPNMSTVDLLFNMGPNSIGLLENCSAAAPEEPDKSLLDAAPTQSGPSLDGESAFVGE